MSFCFGKNAFRHFLTGPPNCKLAQILIVEFQVF
jgi:hypothetical protein